MSSRSISFTQGEYYHIFKRGVEKRTIFKDSKDKQRFQKLLYLCNGDKVVHLSDVARSTKEKSLYTIERGQPLVAIGAYCLMGNHFHLLLYELVFGGISRFMQRLSTAYSMYFNLKNERTGILFEGRFHGRHVDNDTYLKYIYSYIHLNPVQHVEPEWKEKGIGNTKLVKSYLQNYKFSSLDDYLGVDRKESIILDKSFFPEYFTQETNYLEEVTSWLGFQPESPIPY